MSNMHVSDSYVPAEATS